MKVLHTADLHFHSSTLDDLRAPCDRIVEYAREHKPRFVIIAGDLTTERGLIDNATAVAVRTFVKRLANQGSRVFVLAGNHDLTYKAGQPNNLRAILADETGSIMQGVGVVDEPTVSAPFAFLPYPSVPGYHARTGASSLDEINDKLEDIAYGLRRRLIDYGGADGPKILVWHGSVEGGRTGDESSASFRTRNNDVTLPVRYLNHYDAVLCGHLHHPQTIMQGNTPIVYPGCVAPLTFGERTIKPGVELWEFDATGRTHTRKRLPLPVTHQRLQAEIGPDGWDETRDAKLNLWQWVNALDAPPESRVKIKATLPAPRLALLSTETIETVREQFHLASLVVEKTELEVSKVLLDVGQDRAARVDVVETLARYGEYINDPAYVRHLDLIESIGCEIEDAIPQDADPRYGFEPIAIELRNYKQFEHVKLDLSDLPQRAGVLGPTGIGKSNLILAIAAALYGGNPKDERGKARASLASMVRRGETGGMVRLEFRGESGTYRITRRFKLDGRGRGTSALYLEQGIGLGGNSDEYEWVSINEGTSRETQQAIERIVGPEELHWLTRHLRQHGASAVKMTAGDLADAINSTLQLNFDARSEMAKSLHATAVQDRDAAIARRDALTEQLVPLDKIEAQERHVGDLMERAKIEGQQGQNLLERMEAEREQIRNRRARYESDVHRLGERQEQRRRIKEQLAQARTVERQLINEGEQLGEPVDPAPLEALEAEARDRLASAQGEVERAKELKHREELEQARTLGGLEQSRMAAASKRQDAFRRNEAAKRALDDAARAHALISRVPCRGESWHDPVEGEMDGSTCELLADARERAGRINQLTEEAQRADRALKAADEDYGAAHGACADAKRTAAEAREEREERVRAAEAVVASASMGARRAAQALQSAREHEARANAIAQRLAPAVTRVKMLQDQLEELPINEGHLDEQRQALADANASLSRLDAEIDTRRKRVAECRDRVVRCEADLEQLALERTQRQQMASEIVQCKRSAEAMERRRVALEYYRQALSRSGIPSLLLEQLAPQLEARVNSILSPVGRALRIDTERETTTGRVRTEVTLSFRSPSTGDEFVPIAELSGGEEDLCNLALAAGLARVAADMSGTRLGTVILDEPCAGVSESLQAETLEVLHRINEHVDRSVVITHRRDLASACDVVLEVSQNGAGSVVEVVQ